MISILRQIIKTKNDWGLRPLLFGLFNELLFLIKHPHFKYLFVIEPHDLDISEEESKLSDPYVPTPYYILTITMNQLRNVINDFRNSVFIDIGCGTGRAMYCASTIGFNYLVGIEQSKQLSDL